MQLSNIFILATAIFSTSALACKCLDLNTKAPIVDYTKACCEMAGGTFVGEDCTIDSLQDKLYTFGICCAYRSSTTDCP